MPTTASRDCSPGPLAHTRVRVPSGELVGGNEAKRKLQQPEPTAHAVDGRRNADRRELGQRCCELGPDRNWRFDKSLRASPSTNPAAELLAFAVRIWTGGRVAEGTGLENRHTGNGIESSNLSLSVHPTSRGRSRWLTTRSRAASAPHPSSASPQDRLAG